MPVVTISRMFGSGGSEVAAGVATALGWSLLDTAFVDGVANRLGTTPAAVQAIEERAPSLAERIADAFTYGSAEIVSASLNTPLPPTEDRMLEVTRRVIDDAVARGPVVVVGRGAHSSLAGRSDALHVFCCAPHEALVARVMTRDGLSMEVASRLVHEKNRQRMEFVKRNWKRDWLAPEYYHLCVNTAALGIDVAIEMIVGLVRDHLGRDN